MTLSDTRPVDRTGAADDWLTPGRFALLLGLLLAATYPGVLLGRTTFLFRDFGMFSYPVAHFQRECFWKGELPLWNPFNNCGIPFLAQWNTLTLYPPALIYLLLPLTWSLSFFCLAHLFWGGLGMYFLAREWTNHRLGSGLAGLIFSFNGLSLTFLMWPSHVATFSWVPWVLWLGQRGWREGGRIWVWGMAAGAMQMLAGGPETIAATWLILLVLAAGDWFRNRDARAKTILRFAGMGILVAVICAVQLLPFLELLAHSQRDRNYSATTHDWCMPPWGWANFLVPLFRTSPTPQGVFLQNGQYWTTSYYAGIGTVFLAGVAVWRVRDWRLRAVAGLVALGLVLSLGDATLLYRALRFCVPALGFIRYPVKFVILVLALAPLLAAFGLTATAAKPVSLQTAFALVLLCLSAAIPALDLHANVPADVWRATWESGLSRAGFLVLVFFFVFVLPRSAGRLRILLGCLLLLVFWLDFATQTPVQNPGANLAVYARGWARSQLNLKPAPEIGRSRVMVSPELLEFLKYNPAPGLEETYLRNRLALRVDCNLLDDVPQIDGFFSLTPRWMTRVCALPYEHTTNALSGLLDFMGVSHTTAPGRTCDWQVRPSTLPMVTAGQQAVFADDSTVFEALSRSDIDLAHTVFLPLEARASVTATQYVAARVTETKWSNDRVSIQADAPAASLVVVSQTHYPAWRAYVDDLPARIWRANYAFQAVEIPPGRHRVQLIYEPRSLWAGAVISVFGIITCLGIAWRAYRPARTSAAAPVSLSPARGHLSPVR